MTKGNEDVTKVKSYGFHFIITLCICIGAAIIAFISVTQNIKLKVLISNKESTIQSLTSERNTLNDNLETLKKRIEDFKNIDEMLERDIQLYIKTNYQKVPRSVAKDIAQNTVKFAKKYSLSPVLIVGIMQVESIGFDPMSTGPKTKSGANARGLMQVMPEWVKKFDLETLYDLYDIDTNIESGCRVFNIHLAEAKGSIADALYLYVHKDRDYVTKVFTAMGQFIAFRSRIDPQTQKASPISDTKEDDESTNSDKPAGASH